MRDISNQHCQRKWIEVGAQEFLAARNRSPRREFLSPISDLIEPRFILSEDRSMGFALGSDGELGNVFNIGKPGRGGEAVNKAIELGARTLNAFDPILPKFYAEFGFVETGRVPFDPALAPAEWNYARYGTPDVVFMERK